MFFSKSTTKQQQKKNSVNDVIFFEAQKKNHVLSFQIKPEIA